MRLEAVIVCVNYSDFLSHTLSQNKQHFDRIVVVTDKNDIKTKDICEYHHVQCIQTNDFYEGKDKLNKGRGINVGLKELNPQGWVVQLDADIYLPPLTRRIIDQLENENFFDTKSIYGMDRMMCPSYSDWNKFISNPTLTHQGQVYVYTSIFPLGVRISKFNEDGYIPIGFFQMWNPKESGVFEYPNEHGVIDRSDMIHAQRFARKKRHLIPDIVSIHLDSEDLNISEMGKNWNGRKTNNFGSEIKENRLKKVSDFLRKLKKIKVYLRHKKSGYNK